MHAPDGQKWVRGRKILDWVLVGGLILTAVFGVGGLFWPTSGDHECSAEDAASRFWRWTDPVYRFLLLFELGDAGMGVRKCYDNFAIAIARFAGPITVFAGFLRLFWGRVAELKDSLRRSLLDGHTVVVGLGERGRAFVDDAAPSHPIVVVERQGDDEARAFAERERAMLVVGDGREPAVLRRARADRARVLLAATGDDEANLRIADAALSVSDPARPLDVRVMISDPLVRRSLAASPAGGRLDVLSLEELAARAFTERTRLFELVELAGAKRLHLVLAGSGRLQAAMTAQILRASVFPGHAPPVLTLLSTDPQTAASELALAYPGVLDVAEIAPHAFDPERQLVDEGLAAQIAGRGAVTAIVVTGESGKHAFRPALALRDGLRRLNMWRAPVFFAAASPESLAAFTVPFESPRIGEVFEPFPVSASLCAWKAIAAIDETARQVHENYRKAHGAISRDGSPASQTVEALRPWDLLPATYKRANRRAADHVQAKLAAAGCWSPPGPPVLPADLDLTQADLDPLAELEHRAWEVDRRLEGWRAAKVRNDAVLLHDCLVPFEDLSGPTQNLDRAQIQALNAEMLSRSPEPAAAGVRGLVRRDLWVGMIGALSLDAVEAAWWDDYVADWLSQRLLPAAPDRCITLVSPLAPGGDLIAVRRAVQALEAAGREWRLVVPEAVAYAQVLSDFEARWRDGAAGLTDLPRDHWPDAAKALKAAAADLIARGAANRVVPLPIQPEEANEKGYQRQGAYLARRCDVLLALPKNAALKPGGVAETLAWREDPGLIPPDLDLAPRPPRPLPGGLARTVRVEN